jgi:hypothetical protein
MRLKFLELYGNVVVASSSMGVPLVSFLISHAVIPFPETEQEAGGH